MSSRRDRVDCARPGGLVRIRAAATGSMGLVRGVDGGA